MLNVGSDYESFLQERRREMKEECIIVKAEDQLEDRTDINKFRRKTDAEIEAAIASDPDAAPILDEEWFKKARRCCPNHFGKRGE
jgi:hypothetical protein